MILKGEIICVVHEFFEQQSYGNYFAVISLNVYLGNLPVLIRT